MDSFSDLVLLVVLSGVFLSALHLVVRAAVREGVQQALRSDLLKTPESPSTDP